MSDTKQKESGSQAEELKIAAVPMNIATAESALSVMQSSEPVKLSVGLEESVMNPFEEDMKEVTSSVGAEIK